MTSVFAINGSPRRGRGNTALILKPFLEGLEETGAAVETVYSSKLDLKSCTCNSMLCWYGDHRGDCFIEDDMVPLYPKLRAADILVVATPVYIPLPGPLQVVINRLSPLMVPQLEFKDGSTVARFRDEVNIKKIVLVSTGGWWEVGNFEVVVHIFEKLAKVCSVDLAGPILRPHAFMMRQNGDLTEAGMKIQDLVRQAGKELITNGVIAPETLEGISQPLVPEKVLRRQYNRMVKQE